MGKFIVIGERISTTAPSMNKALTERDPEPIIKRAKEQIAAGADYIDVNIGPAESDGEDRQMLRLSRLVFLFTTDQKVSQSLTQQTPEIV